MQIKLPLLALLLHLSKYASLNIHGLTDILPIKLFIPSDDALIKLCTGNVARVKAITEGELADIKLNLLQKGKIRCGKRSEDIISEMEKVQGNPNESKLHIKEGSESSEPDGPLGISDNGIFLILKGDDSENDKADSFKGKESADRNNSSDSKQGLSATGKPLSSLRNKAKFDDRVDLNQDRNPNKPMETGTKDEPNSKLNSSAKDTKPKDSKKDDEKNKDKNDKNSDKKDGNNDDEKDNNGYKKYSKHSGTKNNRY